MSMPYGWYRINSDLRFIIVLAALVAWLVVDFIPYTRFFYAGTEAVDFQEYKDFAGYPAGEGYEEFTSFEEIEECKENYVLKVDVSKLKPTKVYGELEKDNFDKEKFRSGWVGRFGCENLNHGVGRFYLAELSSGDKVCVFLDDQSLKFPKSGEMILPIAKTEKTGNGRLRTLLMEKTGLSEDETEYYVDAAGKWRTEKEGKRAYTFIMVLFCVIFTVTMIGDYKGFRLLQESEERKTSKRGPLK